MHLLPACPGRRDGFEREYMDLKLTIFSDYI
jgi:hypothetical protein